jgi:hypothetical protein
MNDGLAVEVDLQCAAAWTLDKMEGLAEARTSCYKAVVALAKRLQPLSQHLRQRQQGTVAKVASKMHVALLAVAVIILHWPDANLPRRYIRLPEPRHVRTYQGAATDTPHPSSAAR